MTVNPEVAGSKPAIAHSFRLVGVKSQLPTELIPNSKHSVKMPTLLLSVKITLSGVDGIGHRGKS